MNINFGDNNFYVRYLKRFLNNELNKTTDILGDFNQTDLSSLIQYLNLPNVMDMFEVEQYMKTEYPTLDKLFIQKLGDDKITYTSKQITTEASEFIMNNLDNVKATCESIGWKVSGVNEYMDTNIDINNDGIINNDDRFILEQIIVNNVTYDDDTMSRADLDRSGTIDSDDIDVFDSYVKENRLYIEIQKSDRKNYFPNEDMKVFVNQFTGDFLYDYAIIDGGQDLIPHKSLTGLTKIGIYKCTPGQKVTIAHNCGDTCHLVIASSSASLRADITNINVTNELEVDLKPGDYAQYTCSSVDVEGIDANYLLIQCPSDFSSITGSSTAIQTLDIGDINFDGQIDMLDYHLLARYTATGPGAEELKWTPTAKQLAVMNVNTDDGVINNEDTLKLWKFINGDPNIGWLGTVYWEYEKQTSDNNSLNVSNLLIIDGHYEKSVNIPFDEFTSDGWVVHEKFFNYLLGMAVHKYSDSEQIYYVQKLLKEYYPEHAYDKKFFNPGIYSDLMRQMILDYQKSKIHFSIGDLDNDGKLTDSDVTLLQNYLADLEKLNIITKVIAGELTPTGEQINELDFNKNGKIDKEDKTTFESYLSSTYSATFVTRADTNKDGNYNDTDVLILQQNIKGESDSLTVYDNTFNLGWYDMQTEDTLETEVNMEGLISEVSK